MVLLVSGGRDYDNFDKLCEVLDEVVSWDGHSNIKLINGAARGADQLSTRWAQLRGIVYVEVPADWDAHGKVAGPLRNQRMIDEHKPDQAVVFPGGNGTADCLGRLFRAGVPVWVVGK